MYREEQATKCEQQHAKDTKNSGNFLTRAKEDFIHTASILGTVKSYMVAMTTQRHLPSNTNLVTPPLFLPPCFLH